MKSRKRFKRTAAYIILSVCGFIMVFPFLWMVATSFKVGSEVYSMSLIPKHFSIANYKKILGASPFLLWFWNSFLVSGITTASVLISTLWSAMCFQSTISAEKNSYSS